MAFLELALQLRIVLIQDVAVLKGMGYQHYLFETAVFKSEEFETYSRSLHEYIATQKPMEEDKMKVIVPGITRKLEDMQTSLEGRLNIMKSSMDTLSAQIEDTTTIHQMNGFLQHVSRFKFATDSPDEGNIEPLTTIPTAAPLNASRKRQKVLFNSILMQGCNSSIHHEYL